jgi:hypothetical protein
MATQNSSWYKNFARTAAIFTSFMALVLGIIYCGARIGFATNYVGVVRVTGLTLLILNVAPFGRNRWFNHATALVLYTLAGVATASWFLERFAAVGWLWAGAGYVLFAWNLIAWVFSFKQQRWAVLAVFAAALVAGLYASGKTWGLGYNNPLADERLLVNHGHIDALFHSSISNMMRTYGRPSTGLDGVPYIAYHYGSHWLVAALAPVCAQGMFEFYNCGTAILFIPLMFAGLILLAGVIREIVRDPNVSDYALPGGFLFWFVIIAGLIGPFPKKGDMMRVSLMEIYDSDSYAIGLAVSFLVIALLVLFFREWRVSEWRADEWKINQPRDLASGTALLIVFPVLYCVCALLKVSLAYLIFATIVFACLRLGLWRNRLIQLHLLVSGAALLSLSRFITSRGDAHVAFLTFDRIHPEWIPYFLVFYFFWVWAFLALRTWQLRLQTLEDVRQAFARGNTFPAEALLFCTFIGLLPYLTLRFETGSWNYFTQYQTFPGLALVAGYLPSWPRAFRTSPQGLWDIPVRAMFVGVFALLFVLHLGITTFSSVYGLLKDNAQIRAELAGYPADAWRVMLRSLYRASRGAISTAFEPKRDMIACLQKLGEMPTARKRESVVYIPKSNRAYWESLRQGPLGEGSVAFVAPAFTGIAMIDGLPEYEDLNETRRLDYGFWSYNLPTHPVPPSSIETARVSNRARALGFRQMLVIDGQPPSSCSVQVVPLQ